MYDYSAFERVYGDLAPWSPSGKTRCWNHYSKTDIKLIPPTPDNVVMGLPDEEEIEPLSFEPESKTHLVVPGSDYDISDLSEKDRESVRKYAAFAKDKFPGTCGPAIRKFIESKRKAA